MFDVIDFLESVGQDAQWRHAEPEALAGALTAAQIDPKLRLAILAKDEQSLATMLGKGTFCCYINPAKEDEEEGGQGEEGEDDQADKGQGGKKGNGKVGEKSATRFEEES